jgi:hypothetical protein
MLYMSITGISPYDGRYEFDPDRDFTTREWGWIKTMSGYLPLTIGDGFEGGDPELFAALAVVCLHRDGKVDQRQVKDVFERILDAPFGTTLRVEGDLDEDTDEGDAGPPVSKLNGNEPTSGDASATSLETLVLPPKPSGTPAWFFAVGPDQVGELTPAQLMGCVDMFNAIHGAGDG